MSTTDKFDKSVLVVMSGGADSCICLFWAKQRFTHVEAVTFHYGQRHAIEVEQAQRICEKLHIPHTAINLSGWDGIRASALLETDGEIKINPKNGLPTSFVPGRNLVFLTYAAALAYTRDIDHLVTGVCETDFSGYPDCRDSSIKALQAAITLGFDHHMHIHTPLMWLTKAESILLAKDIGALPYLALTRTCYNGKYPACGTCPACTLRIQGFLDAKIKDPVEYEIDIDWSDCDE